MMQNEQCLRGPFESGLHKPVLLEKVLHVLSPHPDAIYVDATFGAGGYTQALLESAPCRVIGIDRDPEAQERAAPLKAHYGDRFTFLPGCFGDLEGLLKANGVMEIDGVVFDIGVSSPQIDTAERGFSFAKDGPLDMRMSKAGETAADVVNTRSEKELKEIFWTYGEEKKSGRIARKIVEKRAVTPITTTLALRDLICGVIPPGRMKIDPATRVFQALRIFVNDELGELRRGLEAGRSILKPEGIMAVVTFHSLEDRIVKQYFNLHGAKEKVSRYLPEVTEVEKDFKKISRKPMEPTEKEVEDNPRARSAKLRWGIKK